MNQLIDFLNCEALDLNLFRGQSRDFKTGQVFGGQVLGQAIKAAYNTVEACLLYTSPSPRDKRQSRMPSSA